MLTQKEEMRPEDVGVALTEEHIELAYNADEDAHSLDMKIRAWRKQEDLYQRNRDLPPQPEKDHCIYFFTGEPGAGKTLDVAGLAYLYRAYYGYEVYSTASLLTGRRVPVIDSLTFAESLPKKAVIFTDEAHTVVDRSADGSYRNRGYGDSTALMRKNKHLILLASMHELRVSPLVKDNVKWLVRPEEAYPANGRYELPPFCYRYNRIAGPYAWRGKTRMEQLGFPRPGGKLKVRTKTVPAPLLYEASKLMNTEDTPDLLAAMNLDAEAMRRQKEGGGGKDPEDDIMDSLVVAWNDGWRPLGKSVDWARVWRVAKKYGCTVEKKQAHIIFKETLDLTTTGRIQVAQLHSEYFDGGYDDDYDDDYED